MSKSMRVFIGGNEYTLKSDDEGILQQAAFEMDEQVTSLKKKHIRESDLTLTVLAGMNKAEEKIRYQKQIDEDQKFLVSEINKMANFLNDNIIKNQTN